MNYEYILLWEGTELAVELKQKMGINPSLNAMVVFIQIASFFKVRHNDISAPNDITDDWFNPSASLDFVREKIKNHLNINDQYQLIMPNDIIREKTLKKLGCDVKSGLDELRKLNVIEIRKDGSLVLLFTNFHQNVLSSLHKYCENIKDKEEYNVLIDNIEQITGLKKSRTQLKQLLREKFFGKTENQKKLIRMLSENEYENLTDGSRLDYIKKARSKISKNGEIYS